MPYIAIMPAGSALLCWPQLPIATADVPYLRAKQTNLNNMLKQAAAVGGAKYVDVYTPSTGHDACAVPGRRWVEPLVPANLAAPAHPNALGMLAVANHLVRAIGR